jgi:hypothetical protein
MKYLDQQALLEDGYLQEVNRGFFHPLGLALELDPATGTVRIQDWRDDPEGIRFEPTDDLASKAKRVAEIAQARHAARIAALGYWQQPC